MLIFRFGGKLVLEIYEKGCINELGIKAFHICV